jgi:hypothetical protein
LDHGSCSEQPSLTTSLTGNIESHVNEKRKFPLKRR